MVQIEPKQVWLRLKDNALVEVVRVGRHWLTYQRMSADEVARYCNKNDFIMLFEYVPTITYDDCISRV
jgi:citrate lyase synthetase